MIGVCIRYFHENYGGMLQAYATIKLLEKYGLQYELIRYVKKSTIKQKIYSLPRFLNFILLNDKYEALLKKLARKLHPEFARNDAIRMQAFKGFKDKYFTKLSPEFVGYEALCQGAERYSAIITGSDQLWSPAGLPTNYYNLMFVKEKIRKISYASSFGVSNIPWYQRRRTVQFLKRLDFISMRENRGSEIVYELIGKEVPTILDPVLSFDKEEWKKFVPEYRKFKEPYIFAYFLGKKSTYRTEVEMLSKKTGFKIVTLRHLDQYIKADEFFGDYAPYDIEPGDFLNLLRFAEYICTDSFHGMCFSIIHHKKFMIFNRYCNKSRASKNSRIDSLCCNLGIEDRRYNGEIDRIIEPIDYIEVINRLDKMKLQTESYLKKVLEGLE